MIFPTNHLTGTTKQNQTTTKLYHKQPERHVQITTNLFKQN